MAADARATDGGDANLFSVGKAETFAKRRAIAERRGMLANDVAAEFEMRLGPGANPWQIGAERAGDDIIGVADENRPIADTRIALNMADHLGVVVGGQPRLSRAAFGHRQVADEIGQPT
jgi:hypothetical protein